MDAGRIVQSGTPAEVYQRPVSRSSRAFSDSTTSSLERWKALRAGGACADGAWNAPCDGYDLVRRLPKCVLIRPEAAAPATTAQATFSTAQFNATTFRGGRERIVVRSEGGVDLELDVEPGTVPHKGWWHFICVGSAQRSCPRSVRFTIPLSRYKQGRISQLRVSERVLPKSDSVARGTVGEHNG
jgi:ABC-type sugar transport system ATPase subunit